MSMYNKYIAICWACLYFSFKMMKDIVVLFSRNLTESTIAGAVVCHPALISVTCQNTTVVCAVADLISTNLAFL